jgi:hypothetical protein
MEVVAAGRGEAVVRSPIYVECGINAPLEVVWRHTQEPALRQRWDLCFTHLEYLPRPDSADPQRFRFEARPSFGRRIRGEGERTGTVARDGTPTSAFRFWSDDPRSLIRAGSGAWRCEPRDDGGTWLSTTYDYETRFGVPGAIFDRVVLRPLSGWATAWSFDRLRLWLEHGVDPTLSFERSVVHGLARVALGATWIYQGLVPKILFPEGGELAIIVATGVLPGSEGVVQPLVGWAEAALGLLILLRWRSRWPLVTTLVVIAVLLAGAIPTNSDTLTSPFNATTLSLTMAALAMIGLITRRDLPSAARCLRRPLPRGNH